MQYVVKHWTSEERAAFKKKHPQGDGAKEWSVEDGDNTDRSNHTLSFHDTEKEAKAEARRWIGRDLITEKTLDLRLAAEDIAREYGVDLTETYRSIREEAGDWRE